MNIGILNNKHGRTVKVTGNMKSESEGMRSAGLHTVEIRSSKGTLDDNSRKLLHVKAEDAGRVIRGEEDRSLGLDREFVEIRRDFFDLLLISL